MSRELWLSYAIVAGGLVSGLLVGGVLTSSDPAILGWVLGGGTGLTAGAFIAAIVAGVPLSGRGPRASGGGGRRGGGPGGHDPLAHLGGAAGSEGPAADAPPERAETEAGGLAALGQRGNGREL